MTVGSILQGAFSLFRDRPGSMAVWGLVNLATMAAAAFALAAATEGLAMSGLDGRWSFVGNVLLILLIVAMISVVLYTAALRAVLRPEEHALASLRLGMDEVRQFLVVLLYLFLFLIALFFLSFILAMFLRGAGAGSGMGALVLYILIFGAGAWFYTKISLSFPMTLKERRIVIGDAWSLTAGRFWTLFGAYVVIFVMMFALSLLVGLVTQDQNDLSTLFLDPDLLQGRETGFSDFERLRDHGLDATMILGWVLSAAVSTIGLTIWAGAAATAAREATGDVDGLTDTFS